MQALTWNVNAALPLKIIFLVCPILLPVFFLFFYNEPELGVGIDPGMALTPLPSSIGRGLNQQPSDCELSALPLDHGFCFMWLYLDWREFWDWSQSFLEGWGQLFCVCRVLSSFCFSLPWNIQWDRTRTMPSRGRPRLWSCKVLEVKLTWRKKKL
jgi:hypothetical protein